MTESPKATISEIHFSNGLTISLSGSEKIIIVGPNNSGKSQTLKDIYGIVTDTRYRAKCISNVSLKKIGTHIDLKNFLELNGKFKSGNYNYKSWSISDQTLHQWNVENRLSGGIGGGFIKIIDVETRLDICKTKNSITPDSIKTMPQHELYDNSQLLEKINSMFYDAFRMNLMINYRGGSKIPFHVGQVPDVTPVDRVSDEYVKIVRNNPNLEEQGDGIKSYVGILFEAIVSDVDMILLDEPEAFLHPPQMRKLGKVLAKESKGQILVATHSSEILKGFLEGSRGNVRIIRLQRSENGQAVLEASPESIKSLWNKPKFRFSRCLEALFHDQVILCEDDSDCRLFSATLEYIEENEDIPLKDTDFIPSGGKSAIADIASTLRGVGVTVKAIFDIDILSSRDELEKTIRAFGGEWKNFESDWKTIDSNLRQTKPKSPSEIKKLILEYLEKNEEPSKEKIIDIFPTKNHWKMVKKIGENAIGSGDSYNSYMRIYNNLCDIGIFIVPNGEIEGFCRSIPGHGPKFVSTLLEKHSISDPLLSDLRSFVRKVYNTRMT